MNPHVLTWNGFRKSRFFGISTYPLVISNFQTQSHIIRSDQIRSDILLLYHIIADYKYDRYPRKISSKICIKVVCGNTPTMFFLDDVSCIVQKNRPFICCLCPLCRLTPPNQGIPLLVIPPMILNHFKQVTH